MQFTGKRNPQLFAVADISDAESRAEASGGGSYVVVVRLGPEAPVVDFNRGGGGPDSPAASGGRTTALPRHQALRPRSNAWPLRRRRSTTVGARVEPRPRRHSAAVLARAVSRSGRREVIRATGSRRSQTRGGRQLRLCRRGVVNDDVGFGTERLGRLLDETQDGAIPRVAIDVDE